MITIANREINKPQKLQFKPVILPESSDAYIKIEQFFFDYPNKELGLNDLCTHLKISKTTANLNVKRLAKEEFLNLEILGKLWRISCNQKHSHNSTRKIPYHLQMIYESGIIEAVHKTIPNSKSIILFGSYRKGDDNEKSDIDLAVEVINNQEQKIVELGIIPRLGYRLKVPVNIHIYSRNKINLNLFANIANGIVLEGFLEARP